MASVAKRGDKWTVRYVDGGNTHRQRTFAKKKDAELYRSKVEIDLSRTIHSAAERMTIDTVAVAFFHNAEQRVRDGRIGRTHLNRLEILFRLHLQPHIGNRQLDQLALPELERWHADLRAKGLAPRTAQQVVQLLKMLYDHAGKREWTFRNPATQLLREIRGTRVEIVRTFDVAQIKMLLEAVNAPMYQGRVADAALRLQCAVHLATFCGLRIGEIFGLRRENVDFAAGLIRVRNSLSKFDGLKAPKTAAGNRDVAMPAHVAALLSEWVRLYFVPPARGNVSALLFTNRAGRPIHVDGFRASSWGALLLRAGLGDNARRPQFHFHALRHFAASWMIENGWSLPEVAGALGHAKVDMTLSVYAHALQNRAVSSDQMEKLTQRLIGSDQSSATLVCA